MTKVAKMLFIVKLSVKKFIPVFFVFATYLTAKSQIHLEPEMQGGIIKVNIRGVSETKISLIPHTGAKAYQPIAEVSGIKANTEAVIVIPADYLPGEFVLRFDYKQQEGSTPYPCEKHIVYGKEPLQLWLNPMYCNSLDSSKYQSEEVENSTLKRFQAELGYRAEKIRLLQQFLMEYDQPESEFYRQGIKEYENRRIQFNDWLAEMAAKDSECFVSSTYRFNYLPTVNFSGSERQRLLNLIDGYFEGIDMSDPLIIRTAQMNDWMNSFVNLHGQMATTVALRDSLIPAAAQKAIEKAKTGHPLVYGWMVDYFYRGFESNNMPEGMKVLQPYLNDPKCLTSKRMEIERRLRGMEILIPGVKAPDFSLTDQNDNPFIFSKYKSQANKILLFFWSADCSHCIEEISKLYLWYLETEISKRPEIIAISLDESEAGVNLWKKKIKTLPAWKHLRAKEGVNSKIANDYYILATPVFILLNSETRKIIELPANTDVLKNMPNESN